MSIFQTLHLLKPESKVISSRLNFLSLPLVLSGVNPNYTRYRSNIFKTVSAVFLSMLLITGCQKSPSDEGMDELSELSLMHETVQIVSDISPIAQQVLSEAYVQETGVQIEWLGLDALGDVSISAKVGDDILIKPNKIDPVEVGESMSAEQALLEGIPLSLIADETENGQLGSSENIEQESSDDVILHSVSNINPQQTPDIDQNSSSNNAVVMDYNNDADQSHIDSISGNYKIPDLLDVLLLHSVYDLQEMAQHNQLQPIASDLLIQRIPSKYQDPNGRWYGLSQYGRALVYNQQKVNPGELLNYSQLADVKWQGRLCWTHYYLPDNQAVLQTIQHYRGDSKAQQIVTGWMRNTFNRTVPSTTAVPSESLNSHTLDSDQAVLDAIEAGYCDVGFVDSDVFMQHTTNKPTTNVRLVWPNQINHGTVANVISSGIAKNSDDASKALAFIEWLASDRGQAILAFYTQTFPVVDITDPSIDMSAVRPSWTDFTSDPSPLAGMFEVIQNPDPVTR